MLKILVLSLFLTLTAQSRELPEITDTTPIKGANLFCSRQNEMYAINLVQRRVWHAEPGATEGVELANVKLSMLMCPNCFDITASLGGLFDVSIKTRGLDWGPATAVVSLSDGRNTQSLPGWVCLMENKKAR